MLKISDPEKILKQLLESINSFQGLPSSMRWVFADSSIHFAVMTKSAVVRGKRGAFLAWLIRIAGRANLAIAVVGLVGLSELARILLQQALTKTLDDSATDNRELPRSWFVGFGAGAELKLFELWRAKQPGPVGRINQTTVASMGCWFRIGSWAAIRQLVSSLHDVRYAISRLPKDAKYLESDFWAFAAIRIAHYSYASVWFRELGIRQPAVCEVCFLSADTTAFAASNVGLKTRFLQHGFVSKSLILPDFCYVEALTRDEQHYFLKRLPNAEIRFARNVTHSRPQTDPKTILVASIYGNAQQMRQIEPFLLFARQAGWRIHVRPHPREDLDQWYLTNTETRVYIEKMDATFEDALGRIRPSFVVSWFSTAIADALAEGIIPITVCPHDDPVVSVMAYPLFLRCLHWPTHREQILRALESDENYADCLKLLRTAQLDHEQDGLCPTTHGCGELESSKQERPGAPESLALTGHQPPDADV